MTAREHLKALAVEAYKAKHPFIPSPGSFIKPYSDKTANGLTRCIIDFIKLTGGQAYRVNSQGQYDPKLKKWRYSGMRRGLPDIQAVINGRFVGIEVKIKTDRQSEHQKKIQAEIEASGGIYFIAWSFDEFHTWYCNTFINVEVRV